MPFSKWAALPESGDSLSDEARRLVVLRRYQILDTPAEPIFDELTRLASQLCGTPIALVTLLDGERQWFKSAQGAGGVKEMPREIAFCSYALQESGVLVIPDTSQDPRFAQNPLVTQAPHVRFYAGAPLCSPEGFVLGTLCVLDTQPRDFTTHQSEVLQILSRQVMAQIELRYQLQQVDTLNIRLQRAMDESHHRIKNNLQVLASLVDIQRLKYPHQVPLSELERIALHIRALGTLHDLLTTKSGTIGESISLQDLLDKLVPLLRSACGGVTIEQEVTAAPLISQSQASSVLLLMGELVSNAHKHGRGTITISVQGAIDNQLTLSVSDEGTGFAASFHPQSAANTGLELIESLACWDLKGTVAYRNTPSGGGCVVVKFPL